MLNTSDLAWKTLPTTSDHSKLEEAIWQAVAYGDVFSYPLRVNEVYRYLVGVRATRAAIEKALTGDRLVPGKLFYRDGYLTLRGREELVNLRNQKATIAASLWPRAIRYSHWISRLPFVRMVAVTGALAMDNEDERDIDYLIVTEPGRLWLCRGLVLILVHLGWRLGDHICPNYFLSENALTIMQRDLFTAHELTQMVPLFGQETYWRMRHLNRWTDEFLPNSYGLPRSDIRAEADSKLPWWQSMAEMALRAPPGVWVENWEMKRKLRKFNALRQGGDEAEFSADQCKGHFGLYGMRTLNAYIERLGFYG
jgi:hypothetical protein